MNHERLLERFLKYVQIGTTANDASDRYPSSEGQWELGRLLVAELQAAGVEHAHQDEHGLVWGTLPPTRTGTGPTIALNAHLDTSPDASGTDVRPQVIRGYRGGDLVLPNDSSKVIRVAENPALEQLQGATLVTTDGTTLLGSDDKSGLAVIVETAAYLMEHPEIPHGPLRLLFTCDEEIGRGVRHVDLQKLAAEVCYTLDGEGTGKIDVETFSGDMATVRIRGVMIHPSIAKGRMVSALRAAGMFLERLPRDRLAPEATAGREGFIHPYQIAGDAGQTTIKILLRDFDTARLADQAELLQSAGRDVERTLPGVQVEVSVDRQYRNLGDGLRRDPRAVSYARRAFQSLGRPVEETIVRGGTDGALLTEQGVPTPNLSTGQHNPHSSLEWTCLEEMAQAAEMLVQLVQIWNAAEPRA